jgi:hypothetical protein
MTAFGGNRKLRTPDLRRQSAMHYPRGLGGAPGVCSKKGAQRSFRMAGCWLYPGADQPPREDHGRAHCRAIHPDRRRPGADGRQPHASLTRSWRTRPGCRRPCTPTGTGLPMPGCRNTGTTWTGARWPRTLDTGRRSVRGSSQKRTICAAGNTYRSDLGAAQTRRSAAGSRRRLRGVWLPSVMAVTPSLRREQAES